ncbi:MAG: hypothetical protein QOI31_2588 [Solirubrobacterales bacterium]|jgi:Ca2+-binding RTX toxin-like protein|nr:hypothetical protein [Solirubrobacterales bacterium]
MLPGSVAAGPPKPNFKVTDGPNDKLIAKGSAANDDLVVLYGSEGGNSRFQISVDGGQTITESSTHCSPSDFFPTQIVFCDYGVSRFVLNQGAGNDKNHFFQDTSDDPWPSAIGLFVNGGAGNDNVRGGTGDDVVKGGTGEDRLFGLNGSDRLLAKDEEKDRDINCGKGVDPKHKVDPVDPAALNC